MKITQLLRTAGAALIGMLATSSALAQENAPQPPFLAHSSDLGGHVVDERAARANSGVALGPRRPPGSQSGQFLGRPGVSSELDLPGPNFGARSGQFMGRPGLSLQIDPPGPDFGARSGQFLGRPGLSPQIGLPGPNFGARSGQFMGRPSLSPQTNLPGPNLGARSGTILGPKRPSKK